MQPSHGMFSAKLKELEQAYQQLCQRIDTFQKADRNTIFLEIQKMKDESIERDLLLEKMITGSRSPGVSELADAELSYRRKVEQGFHRVTIDCHSKEECAESMSLYAEYAIDFAIQAMRHAELSVFTATDLQLSLDEIQKETQNHIAVSEVSHHE